MNPGSKVPSFDSRDILHFFQSTFGDDPTLHYLPLATFSLPKKNPFQHADHLSDLALDHIRGQTDTLHSDRIAPCAFQPTECYNHWKERVRALYYLTFWTSRIETLHKNGHTKNPFPKFGIPCISSIGRVAVGACSSWQEGLGVLAAYQPI